MAMRPIYPRVARKYYGAGPWREVDYHEFLSLVRHRGLDPAQESAELMKGNDVRLGGVVYRLASLVPQPKAAPPEKRQKRRPAESESAGDPDRSQTTLF